jgi:hypothetical protein
MAHPKPLDKAMQSLFNLRFWLVTEQHARLGNVGERLRDVAWLRRLAVDDGVRVQLFFE